MNSCLTCLSSVSDIAGTFKTIFFVRRREYDLYYQTVSIYRSSSCFEVCTNFIRNIWCWPRDSVQFQRAARTIAAVPTTTTEVLGTETRALYHCIENEDADFFLFVTILP